MFCFEHVYLCVGEGSGLSHVVPNNNKHHPLQEGWNKLFMKGAETPVMGAGLLLGSLVMVYQAATAGACCAQPLTLLVGVG